jgi:glycosyltransferase involved in cell wall biosynthesis
MRKVLQPSISVVLPAYNAEERIEKCLELLLEQEFEAFEIIVVDDGSTDQTANLARRALAKSRVPATVLTQVNSGPSAARNAGWRKAAARWVQFIDDDDAIDPQKFKIQWAALGNLGAETAFVHSCWARRRASSGGQPAALEVHAPRVTPPVFESVIAPDNFIHIGSGLISRQWLERVAGFDERWRLIEDVDLQIRLLDAGASFVEIHSERPLYFYEVRQNSLSLTHKREFVEGVAHNALSALEAGIIRHEDTKNLRHLVCESLTQALIFYAAHDRSRFDHFHGLIEGIDSCYVRRSGMLFGLLVSGLGWKRAELTAARIRKWRRGLFSA